VNDDKTVVSEGETRAQRLWRGEALVAQSEGEMFGILSKMFGLYRRYTTDPTDDSIEIYGVPDRALTEDEQKVFFDYGFWVVWTHTAPQRGPGDIEWKYTQGGKQYGHGERRVHK
jgi:hypothetical protein